MSLFQERDTNPLRLLKGGVQTDAEFEVDDFKTNRPWTREDLEKVRDAARTLVRSHRSVDFPDKRVEAGFDGSALWALMTALDRPVRGSGVD
jgi:hypothetical protein